MSSADLPIPCLDPACVASWRYGDHYADECDHLSPITVASGGPLSLGGQRAVTNCRAGCHTWPCEVALRRTAHSQTTEERKP